MKLSRLRCVCEVCSVCGTKEHLAPIKWLAAPSECRCSPHPPNSRQVFSNINLLTVFMLSTIHSLPPQLLGYLTLTCPGVKAGEGTSYACCQIITGSNSQAQTIIATDKSHTNRQECMWCTSALKKRFICLNQCCLDAYLWLILIHLM